MYGSLIWKRERGRVKKNDKINDENYYIELWTNAFGTAIFRAFKKK